MTRRYNRFRYGAWREGPDPLAAPYDVRAAVEDLGKNMLAGRNARDALRELLQRGTGDRPGLAELRDRLRRRREELRRRGNLGGAVDRARGQLDQALTLERDQLAGEETEDARFAELELETLPDSVAQSVQALRNYEWHSAEAKEIYDRITQGLRDEVLGHQFDGLKEALQNRDPQMMQQLQQMLSDLNDLLAAHARGEDTTEQFGQFMDRHGEFFPDDPKNVDELIDQLARRQAETERLLRSLSPEQRAELMSLMEQALQDAGLADQMAQLGKNLQSLRPGMMRGRPVQGSGDDPLGYGEAAGLMGELSEIEALEQQLSQQHAGSTLDDVDVDAVERQLGGTAAEELRALRQLEQELERQGWLRRDGSALKLTPKALRQLGEATLRKIFADLDAHRAGEHDDQRVGAADERTGAFLPWHYGTEQPIDAVRTVTNSVLRRAARPDGERGRRLEVDDFVVAETERRTQAAVALCVDLSFSMVQQERWEPMKQTALALAHLIETRYRQDALEIIGFNLMARRLSPLELAEIEPEWVQGTNLEHALLLAGRHVRRHPEAEPVILVVTDGEPTAHLVHGEPWFEYPPSPDCIRSTVAQVDALSRYGVTLNIFRLGSDPGLERFVDALARRAGGRVLAPSLDHLGQYVVSDYLRARTGRR